jgi:hypothetical protein
MQSYQMPEFCVDPLSPFLNTGETSVHYTRGPVEEFLHSSQANVTNDPFPRTFSPRMPIAGSKFFASTTANYHPDHTGTTLAGAWSNDTLDYGRAEAFVQAPATPQTFPERSEPGTRVQTPDFPVPHSMNSSFCVPETSILMTTQRRPLPPTARFTVHVAAAPSLVPLRRRTGGAMSRTKRSLSNSVAQNACLLVHDVTA